MRNSSVVLMGAMIAVGFLEMGCTKSDSAATTTSTLTLSGTLGTASSFVAGEQNGSMAIDTGNLKVQAVAFTTPPTIVSADVNADGTFSVSLPASKGAATTAYFLDKTDNSQVGVIVFEDTATKDMNGNSSQSSSVVLGDSVALGAIILGTDGKVKVPVANIAGQIGSSGSVSSATTFDPTGTWYMKAFDGTVPTGYSTVGSACGGGPCIGFPMTLIRYAGKNFVRNTGLCDATVFPIVCASTDGTVGTSDRYALSIWGDSFANGVGQCGSRTGFSAAEARAYAGIEITTLPTVAGNNMNFGPYNYTKPAGFGGDPGTVASFNKDWMKTNAALTRDLQDCRPTTITNGANSYNGWACRAKVMSGAWPGTPIGGGTDVYGWQVGVEGGGCFNTTTTKPVNVTNWGTIGMGTCTQTDVSTTYGAGFVRNSCTYTGVNHDNDAATSVVNLTCIHTGGQVTDVAGAPTSTQLTKNPGEYLGQPTPIALNLATCASIGDSTPARKLAAYRCYAEAYWSTSRASTSCARDFRFNWQATTPADFAQDNDRGKPKNAFITNILNYTADGKVATLEDEEVNTITVNTGATSSTFCKASRRTVISFKKISDTRLLVDLRQAGQMNSTSAACVGAAKDALAGKNVGGGDLQDILTPENLMFYADTTL